MQKIRLTAGWIGIGLLLGAIFGFWFGVHVANQELQGYYKHTSLQSHGIE